MAAISWFLVFAATVAGVQCDEEVGNRRVARRLQRLANRFSEQERSLNSMAAFLVDKFATLAERMTESDGQMRAAQRGISDLVASVNQIKDKVATGNLCDGPPTTPQPCAAPYYRNANGGCYVMVYPASGKTRDAASRYCQSMGGGHLLSLETEEEFQALRSYMANSRGSHIWTDGKRIDGQWRWATNDAPFNYTNWMHRKPSGAADCVMIYGPEISSRLQWSNYDCEETLPNYICELD